MNENMNNLRKYGKAPFNVAVIHGGPGAAGEMAPVARQLSKTNGVLEPFQTADSLEGQEEELRIVLEKNAGRPITLVGFSWGAWLSFILAADCPGIIRKIIMIGSGPLEEAYSAGIMDTRLARLSGEDKDTVEALIRTLIAKTSRNRNAVFEKIGTMLTKADAFDPDMDEYSEPDCQVGIYRKVWKDAAKLRRSGKLLKKGNRIKCPVVAIHGDYDPHPYEGVRKPLEAVVNDFKFILLKNCGHRPWIERQAMDEFYRIIKDEVGK